MSKHKTHSGAKKRFKITKNGLVKASHSYRRHILSKKSSNRKRRLGKPFYLDISDAKNIKAILTA